VTPNNVLERTVKHRGTPLGAKRQRGGRSTWSLGFRERYRCFKRLSSSPRLPGVVRRAALYVNVAEHPARMGLETKMAALQWAPSYKRPLLQALWAGSLVPELQRGSWCRVCGSSPPSSLEPLCHLRLSRHADEQQAPLTRPI